MASDGINRGTHPVNAYQDLEELPESRVEVVILAGCALGSSGIQAIIFPMCTLRSFTYQHSGPSTPRGGRFSARTICIALQEPASRTLEHFSLTIAAGCKDEESMTRVRTLEGFSKLKSVEFEARWFTHNEQLIDTIRRSAPCFPRRIPALHEILPATIESIYFDVNGAMEDFFTMARNPTALPCLRYAGIAFDDQ